MIKKLFGGVMVLVFVFSVAFVASRANVAQAADWPYEMCGIWQDRIDNDHAIFDWAFHNDHANIADYLFYIYDAIETSDNMQNYGCYGF